MINYDYDHLPLDRLRDKVTLLGSVDSYRE